MSLAMLLAAFSWVLGLGYCHALAGGATRGLLISEFPVSGPPATVRFDSHLRATMPSLPFDDPHLRRNVTGMEPDQIKVTYWGEGQVVVGWATGDGRMGPLSEPPKPYDPQAIASQVEFWEEGGKRALWAHGSTRVVYNTSYPEDLGGTTYQSPVLHHVLLTGLTPGKQYWYRVGDPRHGFSDKFTFTLPASPAAKDALPFRMAFIGDLGQSANSSTTLQHLQANNPDILIIPGDLTYADYHLSNGSDNSNFLYAADSRRWDSWGRMLQPIVAKLPLLTTVGNHEIEIALDGTAQVAYNARYPMPAGELGDIAGSPLNMAGWLGVVAGTAPPVPPPGLEAAFAATNNYYSVDLPGCHMIVLSSYVPYGVQSQQFEWFAKDIASVDRSVTPWLLVVMHAPFYSSYAQLWKQNEFMRSIYEPVFYKHNVDLVLTGHMHAYERTKPVYNYKVDTCGPAHITIGDGGNEEGVQRTYIEEEQPEFCTDQTAFPGWFYAQQNTPTGKPLLTFQDGKYCPDRQPEWSALRDPSFGHGILELINSTHASWRWYRNQDSTSAVGDSVLYIRSTEGCGLAKENLIAEE